VSRRFTEAEIAEVWERRGSGEPTRSIARRAVHREAHGLVADDIVEVYEGH